MEKIKDEKYLKSIIGRAELSDNLFNKVQNKSSGNDGERYFNAILNCMEHIVYINDFQFTLNNQVQIDMLVIDDRAIYLFEIKNYKGIYYLEDTFFKNNYGNSITSPLFKSKEQRMNFITCVNISR
ncbi:nuclease-related domain-containing protein [Mammaliicoccus sp. P-M55]|uniref:nuclease-related domain-containing protein n=1 Tax=Mammaliicoccus sp. P-M55 TaxID=2898714 RepID=UPI001EFA4874|nr:nuclease-related domain-containing protein [Mammaliicoccus sp. P-M55]